MLTELGPVGESLRPADCRPIKLADELFHFVSFRFKNKPPFFKFRK